MIHALSAARAMTEEPSPAPYAPVRSFQDDSPLGILLVEDDASDAMLAETALDGLNIVYEMHTLENGQEVLPYLCREGKYRNRLRPDIMLLDLSLPVKDGFEVLADLAEQYDRFSNLPIIIVTGATQFTFLKRSYGLTIAGFMTKPCTAEKIGTAIAAIRRK